MKKRNEARWRHPTMRAGVAVPGLLALLAAGGCSRLDGGAAVSQDAIDQAARAIVRAEDRVAPSDLAGLLISDRASVTVFDLRPHADYEAGHIEGARHADLTTLLSADGRAGLAAAASRLILVSADGSLAAQAAALLRVTGINAEALEGGEAGWRRFLEGEETGVPIDAAAARAEAKRQAVACWFEGDYVAAAGLAVKQDESRGATGGYVPPLTPAARAAAPAEDPLGLGLGLGSEIPGATPAEDPLGLGLGLGPGAPVEAKPARRLKIREGC